MLHELREILCGGILFQSGVEGVQGFGNIHTLLIQFLCINVCFFGFCVLVKFLVAETGEHVSIEHFAVLHEEDLTLV